MNDLQEKLPPSRMHNSYADWLRSDRAVRQSVSTDNRRTGRHVLMDVARIELTEAYDDPPTPDVAVAVVSRGTSAEHVLDLGSGRFKSHFNNGVTYVFPADRPILARGRSEGAAYELKIASLPMSRLESLAASAELEIPDGLGRLPSQAWHDGHLTRLVSGLWDAAQDPHPTSGLHADGLAVALVARLLRLAEAPVEPRQGRLCKRALCRALDLLHARIECGVSLEELAAAAGVSPFHFHRQFKRATGKTPQQYLQDLRIDRAQTLMRRHPEWTGVAIALACGFSDQTQLIRHFKRKTGTTPARWQRDFCR